MASISRSRPVRKGHSDCSHDEQSAGDLAARLRRHTPPLAGHNVEYADRVIAASRARGRERAVLYFLANHADEAEEVEMGQQTMSLSFGVAPSRISQLVARLRALGELSILRRGRWHLSNRYRITVRSDT